MKTTRKILRSVATSLLFILLTTAIMVNIAFISLRITASDLPSMIDRDQLIADIYGGEIEDSRSKDVVYKYINDYINYVFHKRSFPSIQTVDYGGIDGEDLEQAQKIVKEISDNLSLEYNSVVNFRKINEITSNRAINLIVNIGLFLILVVTFIVKSPPIRGLKFTLYALAAGGTLCLLSLPFALSRFKSILTSVDFAFLTAIINRDLIYTYRLVSLVSIIVPTFALLSIYLIKKAIIPHFRKRNLTF